ncbi:zinc finger domain-containing protein [Mycolicibacterium gadium]|uniref:DNA-binding phage zinc finger domain-containing protein n=1 Tax=Mycolicibacterium gadium TaxID=1794 RepID=A0A7I7WHR0_MYCGU|nr:hypothetical protein [Mycolicibacterium gadium]BBZ17146.1 hypothetical protein MGAD_14810 [Mycolicibacterium gadium]
MSVNAGGPAEQPEGGSTGLAGGHRRREVAAALQVACPVPTCGAQPGQPCTIRRHHGPDARHRARIEVARPRKPQPAPWPVDGAGLLLLCQQCWQEISGDGYATANHRAAFMRGKALLAWRRDNPGVDVRRGPAPVPWRLVHRACDNGRRDDDFRIDARYLRNACQLLHLSVRLTGKQWVPNTDWAALVAHIMRASAAPEPETAAAAQRRAEAAKRAVPQEDQDG